ncbi:MAG: metallophosphoesterase [Blautia sp.]|nr:metallophosphoesterase [Blautia sp.]MCM1202265.1 metallophosphoesterase [Bacteroides fragilis]
MLFTILIITAILICFFLFIMYRDCHRFVTVEYEIESPKLTREYTFALLSDLHNSCFGKQNEKLISKIEELAPDGILTAGDMLTAFEKKERYQVAADLMQKLGGSYPVYYGMGNHEQRLGAGTGRYREIYEIYLESLRRAGIEPLINEKTDLPSANINICGLQIDRGFYRKWSRPPMAENYLPDVLGAPRKDRFQILIAHNPEYFEEYVKWGADLVVSGHMHGGLVRLPFVGGVVSPRLTPFPHYDGGKFEKDGSVMILSRGLGTHTLPIRMFNPGELAVIRLRPSR